MAIFLLVSCHGSHITIVAEPPQACLSVSQTQDITAVVTGTDQKDVAWSVCDGDGENCVPGGNSAVGTIVATGRDADNNAVARYTAPYAVPSPPACLQTAEGCAVAIKADMVSFSAACFSTITIIAPNPVPSITLLTPDSATEGGTGFTLTVDGADFIASSVVQWNGSDRTTTFVSDTQLTADIPDTDIATAGTADVMVFNPAPGGGTSSPLTFTITAGFPLRVSVASDGTQANGQSLQPAVSGDGRFVAFTSVADNLVANDTNATSDVFLRDTCLGAVDCTPSTIRVSVASAGTEGNFGGSFPALSADGRFVTFASLANLVADDTNGLPDVFLRDTCLGAVNCTPSTIRVSVASDGSEANNSSFGSAISADGRFVAFTSIADNLVANDTNGIGDIFVRDTCAGAVDCTPSTSRVSVASDGTQADLDGNTAVMPSGISADGRFVTFQAGATNLAPGDNDAKADIFVHDRQTAQTTTVSMANDGSTANDFSYFASISADGRFVSFQSKASNLVAGDTNARKDIFVRDTCLGAVGCTPSTIRVSVDSDGTQADLESSFSSISADGRLVAFASNASNLVADDTNFNGDVFVRDTCAGAVGCTPSTIRVSVASAGSEANGASGASGAGDPALSADGRFVVFASSADNLVSGDTNNAIDIFLARTGF